MLKFFFWLLLIVNGALFAYQRGYFESVFPSGREPARLAGQLNAGKVKIVSPPEAKPPVAEPDAAAPAASAPSAQQPAPAAAPVPTTPAPAAPTPAPVAAPTPAAAAATAASKPAFEKVAQAAPQPAAAPEKKPDLMACVEIGNFNPDEAKKFAAQLKTAGLSDRVKEKSMQEAASHLVYIPPQADREAAEKKASELRRLGITDFYIIQDNSPLRWGISLGVFKTEEAARTHLGTLVQKGVRTARIGQRSVTANYTAYQFRDLDAQKKWVVDKLRSEFPKQQERACDGA